MGIGGGGDVVGALGVARFARSQGRAAHVGGVSWERRPVDPHGGPRSLDECDGLLERLAPAAGLAGADTTGPGGFHFAESQMARHLSEPVVLIDPLGGPRACAEGLEAAARRLGCDMVALVDVGGDVLAHGGEHGLASPLCDAVLLAATRHLTLPSILAVFGPACDGELELDEVLARISEVTAAGGLLGAWGVTPADADALAAAVALVPTEASAQAVRCARGETGRGAIRAGTRTVPLTPVGAVTFFLDPEPTMGSAARLAALVSDAASLHAADGLLRDEGVRTELHSPPPPAPLA